ncbi:unnamed protein product [Caenorhabditis bovis]|uniref:Bifunctional coenzyme A synthase n=1 Tax=Caenorhabditis bovis TaxID=2654633 RepID=A0A8S1ETM7_9PELO|nr:unnamed protein product [Caenorhabditis bovis]
MTGKSGLIALSTRNIAKLKELLATAASTFSRKLYIRFNPDQPRTDDVVGKIYLYSASQCPELDVRVLTKVQNPEDYALIGDVIPEETQCVTPKYKRVVLGGTFDRLHNGHKVLLTKAAEIASEKVVVGVTEKNMILKKSLYEMIEPVEHRMEKVVEFVEDITFNVKCIAEPIVDPFGPSTRMEDLEAIVVSRETIKGADAVNRKRGEKGMSQLDVIVVELVEGADEILHETKISSSTKRREALGTYLKPPKNFETSTGRPYVIGLTGGIASGKSSIAKYLKEKHGFDVIDCDKLAHSCYEPGSVLCQKIAETFGTDVIVDGVVDRKKLGSIVFGDSTKLHQLSQLVWPVVQERAMKLVEQSTSQVAVIEAAALVEAGWHKQLPEVWTVFVPPEETIRRVMDRDSVSEDQAKARMASQITNKERIDNSNVVFCSLWEYTETRAQIDKAVKTLLERIQK